MSIVSSRGMFVNREVTSKLAMFNLNFNSSSVVMASFDVTSLFTNIPLDETIDIISNCVFANAVRFHGLTRCEFRKLLCFAVKNCHFFLMGFYTNRLMVLLWVHP